MTLHLFAQSFEHDDAFIVGTRDSLEMLRDSINIALSNQAVGRSSDSVSAHFTSDGEGYDITVKVIPMSVEINLELPYAESIGRELGRQTACRFTVPTE